MNLSRLSLSALHERERSGRRQAAPRPSEAYNADCPERHTAEITISMSQEANEEYHRADSDDDQVDDKLTYVGIIAKVPVWSDKAWEEYARVFQPIVLEGLRAIREYAYDYTRKHTRRALKDDDGDCTAHRNWNNPMDEYSAALSGYPQGYTFGRGCYFQLFPDGLVNRGAFETMCKIAIDRMSGLPTKVMKAPHIRFFHPEMLYPGAPVRGVVRNRDGSSPWFLCDVRMCVAAGLGHVDPDRKEETNPEFSQEQYNAIERRAGQGRFGHGEWEE